MPTIEAGWIFIEAGAICNCIEQCENFPFVESAFTKPSAYAK
jgi:hypothetical protein